MGNESHFTAIVDFTAKGILGRLRQAQGKRSLRAWSRDLGIPHQNLSRYMRGSTPDIRFMVLLARKGHDLNYIIGDV